MFISTLQDIFSIKHQYWLNLEMSHWFYTLVVVVVGSSILKFTNLSMEKSTFQYLYVSFQKYAFRFKK